MSQRGSAGRDHGRRRRGDLAAESSADILERVSDGFVGLDASWRYTYVNRPGAAMLGRRPEELIGRHIWTEFPEGVGQPFHRAYERAMAEQVLVELEAYYEPWDRWFENRIYPSPDGLSIFFHDITERKRTEAAARGSEALLTCQNAVLELVARGTPLPQTLDTLLRGIEAQAPAMLCSILLLDPDGRHVRHAAAPSLPESFVRAVDGTLIGPQAGACGTALYRREPVIVEDIATDPLCAPYRDAALAHGLRACWSTPIRNGEEGVLGTFAMYFRAPGAPAARHRRLVDVTIHTAAIAIVRARRAEEAARREAQLKEAQRIAHLGSYEWDPRTNETQRSAELCQIFGLRAEEFTPTFEAYLERVHPADRSRTRAIIERSARDRTPFDFEERIVRPDGTERRLRSQGTWVAGEGGEPVKLVGICQDITERARAEEERQRSAALRVRNEELQAFAYMVSHDLKAPLRSIGGYARELDRAHRPSLGARGARCLDEIVAAAQKLDRMIEDLLAYSRLDAETPTLTDVSLTDAVLGILRDREAIVARHGTELSLDLAVARIRTWERGLIQLLANLIDNALKYSREASPPRVRVRSERRGEAVRIAVSDNGIGFDMQQHDRLFHLFTRLESQGRFEGTGAGLAIVKKIADRLGASVWAESAPQRGATFLVEIPVPSGEGAM